MTGLLVSVRSAEEALSALAGGASIIDVKEPAHGSLGAANPTVWREVAATVAGAVPLSAALGELVDKNRPDAGLLGPEYQFAKLGLEGCAKVPDWRDRWASALDCLSKETTRVAVAYADWQTAESPEPMEFLKQAVSLGCRALLVDTFDKSRGDLFCHFLPGELEKIIVAARESGLFVVLAGSLSAATLPQAAQLSPDLVAVRGAVCRDSRCGEVDANLVSALAAQLKPKCGLANGSHLRKIA